MIDLTRLAVFDWDEVNLRKNDKHGVSTAESEQVFFNEPLMLIADTQHSDGEARFTRWARLNCPGFRGGRLV
jgi:uncharacterized DUF497 family protein